jgi:hypothetical protein
MVADVLPKPQRFHLPETFVPSLAYAMIGPRAARRVYPS